MKKWIVGFVIGLSFLGATTFAAENQFSAPARHAVAIEANTGQILYEKNADKPAGIASITKLLTAYLVYEAIEQKEIGMDTKVDISDYAYDLTVNSQASNVPLEKRKYTVDQLLHATLISSANSAAIALAEKVAGSEPKFVDQMRAKVKEWGITDATIVNASGLNNSFLGKHIYPGSKSDAENLMSAKDVALISRHLLTDYPQVLDITAQGTFDMDGNTYQTWNYMLKDFPYYRENVTGLKTGTTTLAGASFVASSTENEIPVITVVLHADNADQDKYARFTATTQLLNYIKDNYKTGTIIKKGSSYNKSTATVVDGKVKSVEAVAQESIPFVTGPNLKAPTAYFETSDAGYTAPITTGQEIGTLHLAYNAKYYIDGKLPTTKMVAKENVDKAVFFKVWWNHFVKFVNEKL